MIEIRTLVRTAHGFAALARRTGVGYVGHLFGSATWPKAAYRFGWGPSAPPLLQGVFAAAGEFAASRTDPAELQRLALITPPGTGALASDATPVEIERLMDRAHAAGITGVHVSFLNLVRSPAGSLAFGDLTKARKHHPGSIYFVASRDIDRRAFNQMFGMALPTQTTVRSTRDGAAPRNGSRKNGTRSDAAGKHHGAVTAAAGPGGWWELFTSQIVAPLVAGKRVLDLGSNDGSVPLSMLRSGAREVVAVEFTPMVGDIAGMAARAISWRDVKPYDTQILPGDMRQFLTADLGAFDVITAFGAFRFLPEDEMVQVISRAAATQAVLILQANDTMESLPATTLNLHRLMRDNGFEVRIHTPSGCERPLLVGCPQPVSLARYGDPAGSEPSNL